MKLQELKTWADDMARNICWDPDLRDDIAQEILIEAWEAMDKYDPARSPSKEAYVKSQGYWRAKELLSAKANFVGSKYRHNSVPVAYADPHSVLFDYAESVAEYESNEEVRDAVRELPPKQQEYVFYKFWLNLPGSILRAKFGRAGDWNWSNSTGAKPKLQRALAHLKETS